jgi:hypothetical protein
MGRPHDEERFPYALQGVADALRDERPALTPLDLDRVKLRAMSRARRSASSRAKGSFKRSRMATLLTVGFLMLGTGGTVALAGGHPFGLGGGNENGSASDVQYRPGCGKGDENHIHTGPPGHPEFEPCPPH